MTVWLYTEDESPLRDGPFDRIEDAEKSMLWEWEGVCVWIEQKLSRGWLYENAKCSHGEWFTTSEGLRPAEVIRPEFLIEAVPCGRTAA